MWLLACRKAFGDFQMKIRITLILMLLADVAVGLSLGIGDPCSDSIPRDSFSGRIDLSYSIGHDCQAVDLSFEVSEPQGMLESYAECHINRNILIWRPGFRRNTEAIGEAEIERLYAEYRKLNPGRYHSRSIAAEDSDGRRVSIFCYFSEDWVVTEHSVVHGNEDEITVDVDYIDGLPRQRFKQDIIVNP